MTKRQNSAGFTAVELLVALMIGVMLLGAGYQLYTTIMRDSADNLRRSLASGLAYSLIRSNQNRATVPCTPQTSNLTIPSDSGLGSGTTATLKITCPYNSTTTPVVISNLSMVSVTVKYNSVTSQELTRAIAYRPKS